MLSKRAQRMLATMDRTSGLWHFPVIGRAKGRVIRRLIDRHRWIAYVGLIIVLFVAFKMIWEGGFEVFHAVDNGA